MFHLWVNLCFSLKLVLDMGSGASVPQVINLEWSCQWHFNHISITFQRHCVRSDQNLTDRLTCGLARPHSKRASMKLRSKREQSFESEYNEWGERILSFSDIVLNLDHFWGGVKEVGSNSELKKSKQQSPNQGSRVVLELLPDSHIDLSDTGVWALQMQQQQGQVNFARSHVFMFASFYFTRYQLSSSQVMVLELLISSSAPIGAYTFALETALRY